MDLLSNEVPVARGTVFCAALFSHTPLEWARGEFSVAYSTRGIPSGVFSKFHRSATPI